MSKRRRQVHLRHRGRLNRRWRKRARLIARSAAAVVEYVAALRGEYMPPERPAPELTPEQRMHLGALSAARGGQPWLLPSPEGLVQMATAPKGPGGRPIPVNLRPPRRKV